MVNVKDLTVKFNNFVAVDNIKFTVNKGEIFGFLGANGAGKTTTIRVMCGLLHPTSGSVEVASVHFDKNAKELQELKIKQQVGYMSQSFTLYNDLTVLENFEFIASLRNLNRKTFIKRRDYLLKFISFRHPLNSMVRDLSPGIKQQVALAAAILHDPPIVFLDEPTAGVTPATRALFWSLIRDLAAQDKTIIVTTHYMDEAEQCNRIALMREGKIVALDKPNALKKKLFPDNFYEIELKSNQDYQNLMKLKESEPDLDYFEPFGMHFHVVFKNTSQAQHLKQEFKKKYQLKQISPTLEDVFIKTIELNSA